MKPKRLTIYCDIDGVLNDELEIGKPERPNKRNVARLSRFFEQGHRIVLWTARKESERVHTTGWLRSVGVKYHKILFDKPYYDVLYDDKARRL